MTGVFLGTAAFLEACGGLSKEDIEKMPLNTVEDIIKNPRGFSEIPLIKVRGYGEKTQEKPFSIPILIPKYTSDNKFDGFNTIEKISDVYKIHSTDAPDSPYIKGLVERRELVEKEGFGKKRTPVFGQTKFEHHQKYHIVGKLSLVGEGKDAHYVLKIESNLNVQNLPDTPEMEK